MQNHTKGILYAAVTAFFWGFLAIGLKLAAQEFDSVTIVWFRFFTAFVLLAIWQLFTQPSSFKILIRPPLLLFLAALGLSWNYMGFMLGIHYTTPSNAQLFIQTGPILLAIAGFVIFKEKLNRNQVVGFAIAIIGFVFFYRDQLAAFFEGHEEYNLGVLFTLSGALAWTFYAILQKKLVVNHPVQVLNLFLFFLPTVIYFPFIDLSPLLRLHWTWGLLMFLLGANTLVAYTTLAQALKYAEANKVSIIIIINPVITFTTMGILTHLNVSWIQHERFSLVTILGAALVISGAILVSRKKRKRK